MIMLYLLPRQYLQRCTSSRVLKHGPADLGRLTAAVCFQTRSARSGLTRSGLHFSKYDSRLRTRVWQRRCYLSFEQTLRGRQLRSQDQNFKVNQRNRRGHSLSPVFTHNSVFQPRCNVCGTSYLHGDRPSAKTLLWLIIISFGSAPSFL